MTESLFDQCVCTYVHMHASRSITLCIIDLIDLLYIQLSLLFYRSFMEQRRGEILVIAKLLKLAQGQWGADGVLKRLFKSLNLKLMYHLSSLVYRLSFGILKSSLMPQLCMVLLPHSKFGLP